MKAALAIAALAIAALAIAAIALCASIAYAETFESFEPMVIESDPIEVETPEQNLERRIDQRELERQKQRELIDAVKSVQTEKPKRLGQRRVKAPILCRGLKCLAFKL